MVEVLESFPSGSQLLTKLGKLEEDEADESNKTTSIAKKSSSSLDRRLDLVNSVKFVNFQNENNDDDGPNNDDDFDTTNKENEATEEKLGRTRYLRRSKTMPAVDTTTTTTTTTATSASVRLSHKSLYKENSTLTMQSCQNLASSVNLKLNVNPDRFKMAKDEAERAIKERKIFMIVGPYQSLRNALRRRGWVEKFDNNAASTSMATTATSPKTSRRNASKKKNHQSVDDDGSSGDDDPDDEVEEVDEIKPWEENNGYYSIVSRLLKSFSPNFIWTVKATTLDYPYLTKDQFVNHYNKNGAFTTKIGLCSNIRNITWYSSENCDEFFPRCYKLCQEDDRKAFIDDYRITSCISLLKYFLIKYRNEPEEDYLDVHITSAEELMNIQKKEQQVAASARSEDHDESQPPTSNRPGTKSNTPTNIMKISPVTDDQPGGGQKTSSNHKRSMSVSKSPSSKGLTSVPVEAIEFAIEQMEAFIDFKENNDLDKVELDSGNEEKWSKLSEWFYASCHDKKPFQTMTESLCDEVVRCLEKVKAYCPQFNIDGFRNIWIVKPGALSRGRGIIVFDKLENILELNRSPLQRDGKYVVQKYIERPLLIHKIKFDIRQWFLVTDFNPLTIWMYKDCYLRFCTQKFTLDSTQQSVHLCNYSIQKNYKNDVARDQELPEENMWSSGEFVEKYLTKRGLANKWSDLIYPGMKQAILNSMLSAQDIVEARKNSFELYGADFMLGDDLKPWLIEINCSPTMAKSTEVTKILCDVVLEDVCKVIIDRRTNKNADTGRFELIYKASPVTVPNYLGTDLKVDGFSYKKAQQQLSPQQQQQIQSSSVSGSLTANNRTAPISTSIVLTSNSGMAKTSMPTVTQQPSPTVVSTSNETINITSLEFKSPMANRSSTNPIVNSSKLAPSSSSTLTFISTRNSLSQTVPPSQNLLLRQPTLVTVSSLNKETTSSFPAISFNKISPANRLSEVSPVNAGVETTSSTNLLGNKKQAFSNSTIRHSMIDLNHRGQDFSMSSTTGINEPKLFEFKHFQKVPVNKYNLNRPLFVKHSSYSSQQSNGKTKTYDERYLARNDFSIKLNKRFRKNNKGKQLLMNKLEVSDLNHIQYEK